ncbi:MAG: FkbM family methyltransferase [Oligoflexia bacterium]|nr:FkbM family methyltransferase [Oligoflexia bacterium]
MLNKILLLISKRRWLKRIILPLFPLPTIGYLNVKYESKSENCAGKVFLSLHDFRGPSFYIMYDGEEAFFHYEKKGKERLFSLINQREGTFIDIGANIGLFSVFYKMKKNNLSVVCFEPNALAFSCLEKTKSSFKFKDFTLENLGVADKDGELPLYSDDLDSGGHSFIREECEEGKEGKDREEQAEAKVKTVAIDSYLAKRKIEKISAIKMDVEGFEINAVKGMLETIKKYHPPILLECQHANFKRIDNLQEILINGSIEYEYKIEHIDTEYTFELKDWREFALKKLEEGVGASDYLLF